MLVTYPDARANKYISGTSTTASPGLQCRRANSTAIPVPPLRQRASDET